MSALENGNGELPFKVKLRTSGNKDTLEKPKLQTEPEENELQKKLRARREMK